MMTTTSSNNSNSNNGSIHHNYDELRLNDEFEEENLIASPPSSSKAAKSYGVNSYLFRRSQEKSRQRIKEFKDDAGDEEASLDLNNGSGGDGSGGHKDEEEEEANIFSDKCSINKSSSNKPNAITKTSGYNLDMLAKTNNIVAAIDPTFQANNKKSSTTLTMQEASISFNCENQNLLIKFDDEPTPKASDGNGYKPIMQFTHDTTGTNDFMFPSNCSSQPTKTTGAGASIGDIFMPVQGQKRLIEANVNKASLLMSSGATAINKPSATRAACANNRASNSQCLQQ